MSKRLFVTIAVTVCVIAAAGGILASNMGFKLNYALTGPAAAGGIGTGKNTLSLPYFRQTGLNDALQLMQDIGGGVITPVASVAKFNESSDTFATYTGRRGSPTGTPFALTAGEGYLVQMNTNVNYIVVGSHDPALSVALDAPSGSSATGKNYFAPPYNITSANALALMQDIGGGVITPVASVAKFNKASDTYATYTGRRGSPTGTPFALAPGEAYLVQMNTTVPYIASHY